MVRTFGEEAQGVDDVGVIGGVGDVEVVEHVYIYLAVVDESLLM